MVVLIARSVALWLLSGVTAIIKALPPTEGTDSAFTLSGGRLTDQNGGFKQGVQVGVDIVKAAHPDATLRDVVASTYKQGSSAKPFDFQSLLLRLCEQKGTVLQEIEIRNEERPSGDWNAPWGPPKATRVASDVPEPMELDRVQMGIFEAAALVRRSGYKGVYTHIALFNSSLTGEGLPQGGLPLQPYFHFILPSRVFPYIKKKSAAVLVGTEDRVVTMWEAPKGLYGDGLEELVLAPSIPQLDTPELGTPSSEIPDSGKGNPSPTM